MSEPVVSVIIIFLNGEQFLKDAIDSVISQSYTDWELLLVDDGSDQPAIRIASNYVTQFADKVHYLEHPNHANRGISASRNLGISRSRGRYVAFLDADDSWLPEKLAAQIRIMEAHPDAGMVYGRTRYWYSWANGKSAGHKDFQPKLGVAANTIHHPPSLLAAFVRGSAAVPCTCSILVRRDVAQSVSGFDDSFKDMYEDQVFYAKMSLRAPIYVSDCCWDLYRRHKSSITAQALINLDLITSRIRFLRWLLDYLEKERIRDRDVWEAVTKSLWECDFDTNARRNPLALRVIWRARKLLLRIEESCFPKALRHWLWTRHSF